MKKLIGVLCVFSLVILGGCGSSSEDTTVCTLSQNDTEMSVELYPDGDNLKKMEMTIEGDMNQEMDDTTLEETKSTIQSIYGSIDGITIDLQKSDKGNTYAKMIFTFELDKYDFETDSMQMFTGVDTDTLEKGIVPMKQLISELEDSQGYTCK